MMDRLFRHKSDPPIYEPVPENYEEQEDPSRQESRTSQDPFSWIEYLIFMLLGVSMLWAW